MRNEFWTLVYGLTLGFIQILKPGYIFQFIESKDLEAAKIVNVIFYPRLPKYASYIEILTLAVFIKIFIKDCMFPVFV